MADALKAAGFAVAEASFIWKPKAPMEVPPQILIPRCTQNTKPKPETRNSKGGLLRLG